MFFLWKCTVRVQGLPDMDGISPINMEGMTRMVSEFSPFKNLFDAEDRWWNLKYVLFSPQPGEMIQFDEHIFQMGWFNNITFRGPEIMGFATSFCDV